MERAPSPRVSPSPPLRVAFCITGQLRAAACGRRAGLYGAANNTKYSPAESIRDHLIDPLRSHGAHVDVFTVIDAPPARIRRPGITAPLLRRALEAFDPVQAVLHDEASDSESWEHARRSPFGGMQTRLDRSVSSCGRLATRFEQLLGLSGLGGGTTPQRDKDTKRGAHKISSNHFLQARKLQTCYRLVSGRESYLRANYTHIVRVRPDLLWHRTVDLATYLQAETPTLSEATELCVQPRGPDTDAVTAAAVSPAGHSRSGGSGMCYAPCAVSPAKATTATSQRGGRHSVARSARNKGSAPAIFEGSSTAHHRPEASRDGSADAPAIVQLPTNAANLHSFFVHDQFYVAQRVSPQGLEPHGVICYRYRCL